jgi:hypothetical protein
LDFFLFSKIRNGTGGLAYGAVAVANLPHKDVDTVVHREGHGAGLFVYVKLLMHSGSKLHYEFVKATNDE